MITDFADNGSLSKNDSREIVFNWDARWRFAKDIADVIDFFIIWVLSIEI